MSFVYLFNCSKSVCWEDGGESLGGELLTANICSY